MLEIEKTILSEIMQDNRILDEIRQIINIEVFEDNKCRLIYKTFLNLQDLGEPIGLENVYTQLTKTGSLNFIGGVIFISELSNFATSTANFLNHCKLLLEKWMLRETAKAAQNIIERVKKEDDIFEILSAWDENIYEIENNIKLEKDLELWSEHIKYLETLENKFKGKIPEGIKIDSFPTFNTATGGIMSSDYIVIYGEDKQGKTTVTERLLTDVAFQKIPIGLFTLEMDFESTSSKIYSMETNTEYLKLRNPRGADATENDLIEFSQKIQKFRNTKIFIDDKTFDFDRILGKMRLWKRKYNIGMFAIDYLGLLETVRRFKEKRFEIADFSRRLKQTAKELNTPVIVVCQANQDAKTAESVAPLRDCDFALHCMKPVEKGIKAIEGFTFNENHFLVTIERSRHGRNKQNFVCGYVGTNFKELKIDGIDKGLPVKTSMPDEPEQLDIF